MTTTTRARKRIGSIRSELLAKAREAALSAVQTFNNPLIQFKSETFIVLMIIAWTYLLHAYYRREGIDYRYFETRASGRRKFDRTKRGSFKFWELERCLNDTNCPLNGATSQNLRFLIGLRHEIEHQMTTSLDSYLSARYQACALNFNRYIQMLFGEQYALDPQLAFSIQFAALTREQVETMAADAIPARVIAFIAGFDNELSDDEFNSENYSYRVLFTRKLTGKRGQADSVFEFISPDSLLAKDIDKQYWVQKEVERPKLRATDVVRQLRSEGFVGFGPYQHTQLWRSLDAKNPGKGFGVEIAGMWYWYERWVDEARRHCHANAGLYRIARPKPKTQATSNDDVNSRPAVPGYLRSQ